MNSTEITNIMKKIRHYVIFILLVLLTGVWILVPGCDKTRAEKKKELLIYCGITMIKPITEIAKIIEKQEDCRIIITKGGSGNLLKSLRVNKAGDLYVSGSDSYIKTCLEENLVSETAFIGYNKAALMVQKGNPKHITGDLDNLMRKDYYVVICNPDTGSIGKETKKILERKGIFEEVQANACELTTDSKKLITVLKEKKADIIINWYACSTWEENEPYVDVLTIDEKYAEKKKLVLGLLKTSKYPEIAQKFMDYAASDSGRELFKKYGLYDIK